MIAPAPRKRIRYGRLAPPPDKLTLNLPAPKRPGGRDFFLALAALGATAAIFFAGGELVFHAPKIEDEVKIIDVPPPLPPPKSIAEPPKPVQPPREKTPPPVKAEPPPPPQFGIEKEATSEKGDLAVATGNTLLKKSDSIVKPEPPPPPPAPMLLDQEPDALEKIKPIYPEWAEEQGVTSRVLVMVTIDAQGKVFDTQIEKSGGKDFDQAALSAAKVTRYKPYVEKGKPLPARFVVPYEFTL